MIQNKRDQDHALHSQLRKKDIRQMTTCAMCVALITISTMLIRFPIPATEGYIHPGDGLILLSAFSLGSVYGALAAGLGSALADLLSGYALYAPATLIIKAFSGMIAAAVFLQMRAVLNIRENTCILFAGLLAELWMVLGYFLFECFLFSPGVGMAGVPFNLVQGIFGVVIALILSAFTDSLTQHR